MLLVVSVLVCSSLRSTQIEDQVLGASKRCGAARALRACPHLEGKFNQQLGPDRVLARSVRLVNITVFVGDCDGGSLEEVQGPRIVLVDYVSFTSQTSKDAEVHSSHQYQLQPSRWWPSTISLAQHRRRIHLPRHPPTLAWHQSDLHLSGFSC
jgi:hypothetical protein